jgi:ABC-type branched-subunit amino acid transport system substrate-binding protein
MILHSLFVRPRAAAALLASLGLAAAAWAVDTPAAGTARKGPILIAQTAVLTGPSASLSPEPQAGIRAMVAAVNARGGIHGRPLELLVADDVYDAAKAEENVRKLADAGAVAIVMPIGTVSAVGALKAANELKIPVVGPYSGADPVAKFSEYCFPVRISFAEEYGRIVKHLFTIGITRIAFAHNDNPGARASMEVTKKAIEANGGKMLGSVSLARDAADAPAKAAVIAAMRPDAVVLAVTNPVAEKFIRAYRHTGASTQFYSFSFLDGMELHRALGGDSQGIVISQVVPNPWNSSLPLVAEYQQAMRKSGRENFSHASLEGYVGMKVLVEALKRAGPEPTRESSKRALEALREFDLGGLYVRYGPNDHAGLSFNELTMVNRAGKYVR